MTYVERLALLFITPAIAAPSGHGTSMRIAAILSVLSKQYSVSVLFVDLFRRRKFNRDLGFMRSNSSRFSELDLTMPDSTYPYLHERFDAIHVCRLAALQFARPYIDANSNAFKTLDLDDFESDTHARFAVHAASRGDFELAQCERRRAREFATLEKEACSIFDRIFLSNPGDCSTFAERHLGSTISNIPNCIFVDACTVRDLHVTGLRNILFVGTLDFYPNTDGVRYFCDEIWPVLTDTLSNEHLELRIVGTRPERLIEKLKPCEGIHVVGEVEDLSTYYRDASLVIAPLRVGGGTRMKILEAFAYGRPTVATEAACLGLDIEDGKQILLANDARSFAMACARILTDGRLARGLGRRARRWVQEQHDIARLRTLLWDSSYCPIRHD